MKNLRIVLVSSKYPRNIGLVSRIMANFGINRLILVTPQCILNEEANQGAAQGQAALENVKVYNSWPDFFDNEDDGPRVAFSRRQGKRRASITLKETLNLEVLDLKRPTYLIFGAEDHGLSAEDLEHVHRLAHFDLPGELQSMNLSHSVLVAVKSFYDHFHTEPNPEPPFKQTYKDPEPFLRAWLESMDFELESQSRWNALTMLKQLIMKATPTEEELHKLEMIVQQSIRRIKDKSS